MIEIRNLSLRLADFSLRGIDLTLGRGEYAVLLGPTGAGKSVLLECLAGIHRTPPGTIAVDGQDLSRLPPERRGVGYVPQDYALFPNMTVEQNMAYGLKARGRPAAEIARRVTAELDRLRLAHLRGRHPLHLSGGEQQRVALGRALITEPQLLLLDEPLSSLDEELRATLAAELREIQRDRGCTFLHVCHSLEEAYQVADRVALLHSGVLEQAGPLEELLARPSSLFVAAFTRSRNLIRGLATPARGGTRVRLASGLHLWCDRAAIQGPVIACVRPWPVLSPSASTASSCSRSPRRGSSSKPFRHGHSRARSEWRGRSIPR